MGYFLNSPAEAETAFYSAFEHLDMELMRATWHRGDDVVCIHPGGPLHSGFDSVMSHWNYVLKDTRPPELNYRIIRSVLRDDIAIHFVEETIGSGQDAAVVLATNIYLNTEQGWRMLSHHASLPPRKVEPETTSSLVH